MVAKASLVILVSHMAGIFLKCVAETSGQDVLEWIQSRPDGFVSDKIVWKKANDDDDHDKTFGFFAVEDIPKDTHLMIIPESIILGPADSKNEDDCQTVEILLKEYDKGKDSEYYPYVDFLFGDVSKRGVVPSTWTPKGQQLLRRLIGRGLEPEENAGHDCAKDCPNVPKGKPKCSVMENAAYFFIVSRAWNADLVPGFDMVPHRNGKGHNVDADSILPDVDGEIMYAIRDIRAGEQLFTSLNECTYGDCQGMKYTYITPDILQDYGFVEHYPRRWRINDREDLVAQVDVDEDSGERYLSWPLGKYPDLEDLTWIQSQLKRLNRIEEEIKVFATDLESVHERNVIMAYYNGYKELLELAFVYREAGLPAPPQYDPLTAPKGLAVEGRNTGVCDSDPTDRRWQATYTTQSQYQEIAFRHNKYADNTCMYLSDWLQTCSNVRPHYHEAFVHVAGQYVDKVKRVIYLGGGDNMILHEILKFPDLELVVGMELDQQVCRSAFQYLGTLPYFDDPRVQWWFGDATKSLFALPESYFGSFDLVLVDLQTFVADALKVTDKLSIMDTAILLMKQEGGVIAKNEDFSVRTNVGFAKYTVDLEYHDLPRFCLQSITLGSNSIDFMTATPKNHGIETLAVDLVGSATWDPYHAWFGYRQSIPNSCAVKHVKETFLECGNKESGTKAGIFVVVEVEDISIPLDSMPAVRTKLSKVMEVLGLAKVSISTSVEFDKNTVVFILNEGYVTARVFEKEKYIGFDLHLWENIDTADSLKEGLISALGGNFKKVTSFRFVTSGMFGLESCPKDVLTDIALKVQRTICNLTHHDVPSLDKETASNQPNDVVLQELLTSLSSSRKENSHPRVVGVLCGDKSSPCASISAVKEITSMATEVVPIFACADFDDMPDCEMETKKQLEHAVNEMNKMDVLVFDSTLPFSMGQVLERVFSDKVTHNKVMQMSHVVLSHVPAEEEWKSVLVDRFRTDFVLFDPAHRANIHFLNDGGKMQGDFVKWSVFSTGDDHFFNHLSVALTDIQSKTRFKPEVKDIANGLINVIADFNPPKVFKNSDYDRSRALAQWHSQTAVGHQTLFQMMVQPPKAMVRQGETVLVALEEGPWDMVFGRAVVLSECSSNGYDCEVQIDGERKARDVPRDLIRKLSKADTDPSRSFKVGDLVLHEFEEGMFENGVVSGKDNDGTYAIYLLNTDGEKLYGIPRTNLVLQYESAEFVKEVPDLSATELFGALGYAIKNEMLQEGEDMSLINSFAIGSGVVLTAFWSGGHVVLKWDGQKRVEINLFTVQEMMKERVLFQESFVSQLDFMETVSRDEHPRGYGSIVNFGSEMEDTPYWVKQLESAR